MLISRNKNAPEISSNKAIGNQSIKRYGILYMGKFKNMLLCCDLDGTLLNSQSEMSENNRKAIEYFKSQGGKFTFVTGRATQGIERFADMIDMPVVLLNGAEIYDFKVQKAIWTMSLFPSVSEMIRQIENVFNDIGIIVFTDEGMYYTRLNQSLRNYYNFEDHGAAEQKNYAEVCTTWRKILLVANDKTIGQVRNFLAKTEYVKQYSFMQSGRNFYEILPLGANKWSAISELQRIVGMEQRYVICVGDSENDVRMLEEADLGIAVKNAMQCAKIAADYVLVSNNDEGIMAEMIRKLQNEDITDKIEKYC